MFRSGVVGARPGLASARWIRRCSGMGGSLGGSVVGLGGSAAVGTGTAIGAACGMGRGTGERERGGEGGMWEGGRESGMCPCSGCGDSPPFSSARAGAGGGTRVRADLRLLGVALGDGGGPLGGCGRGTLDGRRVDSTAGL